MAFAYHEGRQPYYSQHHTFLILPIQQARQAKTIFTGLSCLLTGNANYKLSVEGYGNKDAMLSNAFNQWALISAKGPPAEGREG